MYVYLNFNFFSDSNTKQETIESKPSDNNLLNATSIEEVAKHFMDNLNKYNIVSLVKNDDDASSEKL